MTQPQPTTTAVLFVCVKNGGKSQMAAGLMRRELEQAPTAPTVRVDSAGTQPGTAVNALSAEVLRDLAVDITAEVPKQLTEQMMRDAGHVVVLGAEAQVPQPDGVLVERWETDEPSLRDIEGRERMELVRDDIRRRVQELVGRLTD